MQDKVDACTSGPAIIERTNVAPDETKSAPLFRSYQGLHLIEIMLVAASKVVQANHSLIQLEQRFEQVAADETGDPGYQPAVTLLTQLRLQLLVTSICGGGHQGRHST
jgi:hypothetical protein